MGRMPFTLVEGLQDGLARERYLADRGLATAIYLAVSLDKPLLLEGEAGVGKTEVAKVLATLLDRELIRLQCYEGIDASQALYECNYTKQLIAGRVMSVARAAEKTRDRARGRGRWGRHIRRVYQRGAFFQWKCGAAAQSRRPLRASL